MLFTWTVLLIAVYHFEFEHLWLRMEDDWRNDLVKPLPLAVASAFD
jgi:hypothetical protein